MQSHIIFSLFLLIEVCIGNSHHEQDNVLIQATPETEIDDNVSPACTQSMDLQPRSTQAPDTVSRRTMSGTELIRGSLPVNSPSGVSRLLANAFRNFFVHPDSIRNRRFKRQNYFIQSLLFPRPKLIKHDEDDVRPPPTTSSTSPPVTTTMSTLPPVTTTMSTTTTTVLSTLSSTSVTTERTMKPHFKKVNNINVIIEVTTMASEETTAATLSQTNNGALIGICNVAIIVLSLTFIFLIDA